MNNVYFIKSIQNNFLKLINDFNKRILINLHFSIPKNSNSRKKF